MKKLAALAMLSLLLTEGRAQVQDFQWLIGRWKLGDRNIYEVWKQADGQLIGEAFEVKGSDTIVTEVISLQFYKNAFHYIPDVAGDQPAIDFVITSSDNTGFVAENPNHDFPKKIVYQYSSEDKQEKINAVIEGGGKSISYSFHKVE